MRTLLVRLTPFVLAALVFAGRMPTQPTLDSIGSVVSPSIAAAQEEPKPNVDVAVNVDRGTHVWYTDSTTLLIIGGGGLVLLIAFIALASRGGGTTIIREK